MTKQKDYMKDKDFNLRKMVKLVNDTPKLSRIYMDYYTESQKDLGYHYNEIIMGLIYLLQVKKDSSLQKKYATYRVTDDDPTRIINEEEIDETTTASSSGSYSSPNFVANGKSIFSVKPAFQNGTKVKMNTNKHPQGIDTFVEEKTKNMKDVEKIQKETEKLSKQDEKISNIKKGAKNLKDLIKYDKDSFDKEDLVKRNLTDEENEEILKNRGMGMEDVDVDNKEWEDRVKKQMKSPNTDLDMFKHRELKKDIRKDASAINYVNNTTRIKESIKKLEKLFDDLKNVEKANK